MTYLLAKYAVVFLLTALFGFLLGRWWVRRSFVDVTESYETISRAAAADVPWDALWARFDSVDTHVERIVHESLAARPLAETTNSVDLSGVLEGIKELDVRISNLAPAERIDLTPLYQRIERIEAAVREIRLPATPELGPVSDQLQIIESNVTRRAEQSVSPKQPPRLLQAASFGKPDDLKRISGVGPKIERLLNTQGIFYFWQVADWSDENVRAMDDRLESFNGRIARDNWVGQARALASASISSPRPPNRQLEMLDDVSRN